MNRSWEEVDSHHFIRGSKWVSHEIVAVNDDLSQPLLPPLYLISLQINV